MTNTMTMKLALAALLMMSMGLVACGGKIPSNYQGTYVDKTTGARLKLESSEGTLKLADGREIKAEAKDLSFDLLNKGETGIYTRIDEKDENVMEVFWLSPRPSTRKEEHAYISMEAEVVYTSMNLRKRDQAQTMTILHCYDGMIYLDAPTKWWNGGCPAGSPDLQFDRAQD